MSEITIRCITGADYDRVLTLWNEAHPWDPTTERFLRRKVFLDVNFDPEGYLLAESDGKLVGYVYVVRRLQPVDNEFISLPDKAWINGFGLSPELDENEGNASNANNPSAGDGSSKEEVARLLLGAAENYARAHGIHQLAATSYSPFYFTQGFDVDHEKNYIQAFLDAGYEQGAESYARDIDLLSYQLPGELKVARKVAEDQGFYIGALTKELLLPFWAYMNRYQGAGWRIRIRELLYSTDDLARVRVIAKNGEVIGFNVFGDPDGSPERFGPFGIREEFRGLKLGQLLLADCLLEMKKRGLHNAWMQWTCKGGAADFVYEKAGFRISRRHVVMTKIL